ncbi:MAG: GGDEF domain-containing protein [Gammaproteobacteria bacterium]|nr:GGDEF domain-containing protein [Gammaproteobacteria bacterium]
MLRNILQKYSRLELIIASTILAIILTQLVMFIIYSFFSTDIRFSEIIISIIAPLVVASIFSWFFIDMIKKLNSMEIEMRYMATYDQLTKTLTRKEFFCKADEYRKIIVREKFNCTFLMIDIDYFKEINDMHGHLAGDYVLSAFGEVLNKNKRDVDLVGRFGGEEFIVLLWGCDSGSAFNYAVNLQALLSNIKLTYNNIDISFTVSIGISLTDVNNQFNVNELIEQADKALYQAKENGRNKTLIYNPAIQRKNDGLVQQQRGA